MPEEYTREQLWQLYEKLPGELKEVVFSSETADAISEICGKNGIEEVPLVATLVGQVLLGVLPPDDFPATLEKRLKLKKDIAKKAAQELYRFIFYPVKPALEELYKTEVKPAVEPSAKAAPEEKKEAKEEKPKTPMGKDVYREPIE